LKLEISRIEGRRNDLVLRLERDEIETALLSVPFREALMALPGIPRHREATADEAARLGGCRVPIASHLQALGVVDATGRAVRRAVAISNRNLGTNHGHLAWQRAEAPPVFRVREDPADRPLYSCLTAWHDGRVAIDDLRFDVAEQRVRDAGERDVGDAIEWATYGQRVLREGRIVRLEDVIDRFYDIRHVLAFDPRRTEGARIARDVYAGYPETFAGNVRRAWREAGVPRARYYHHAVGVSEDAIHVVQREGTVEEIGAALKDAGAQDGVILDNGGSVACWAWWVNDYAGGLVSPTVDYRPEGTSAVAFILKGPVRADVPGGSVSFSVL
jgi:hypothetical protein